MACITCVESLQQAFNFISAVERAQSTLNDLILEQQVKKEENVSDDENFIYEGPADYEDDMENIKILHDKTDSTSKSSLENNTENSLEEKKKSGCNENFKCREELAEHTGTYWRGSIIGLKTVDNVEELSIEADSLTCTVCNKTYSSKKSLVAHMLIHARRSKEHTWLLNQHLRLHTGVKPYSCNICQRGFTNWSNYNKHMKRRHNTDMAKTKRTPQGSLPIDPATGEVVYDKSYEAENNIMEQSQTPEKYGEN
uniref:C2H2-type domain-containing protein n=1 Tax=Heliothis virescens TaxID=7102 RepID=A0A2A4IY28_HELVI